MNTVGRLVDTCDDVILLKVTECLIQAVVPGEGDLPTVLHHWWNVAVTLDVRGAVVQWLARPLVTPAAGARSSDQAYY